MADEKTFIKHPTLGSLLSPVYCRGIIKKIKAEDLCDVELEIALDKNPPNKKLYEDIPLFYHCNNEVEQRENGALYDAAGAFKVDDKVIAIAMRDGKDYKDIKVVGFDNQAKRECTSCSRPFITPAPVGYGGTLGTPITINRKATVSLPVVSGEYKIYLDKVTYPEIPVGDDYLLDINYSYDTTGVVTFEPLSSGWCQGIISIGNLFSMNSFIVWNAFAGYTGFGFQVFNYGLVATKGDASLCAIGNPAGAAIVIDMNISGLTTFKPLTITLNSVTVTPILTYGSAPHAPYYWGKS